MSLSSSLYTSLAALEADQGALAVTSNNIANVNTPGYSRQVAELSEAPTFSFGDLQFGTGVNLTGVQGIRDNVLQMRLNQQAQTQGRLNTFVTGMNQVQSLFNEPAGSGLQSLLSNFYDSFQQLAADPTNLGLRQTTISNAQSLAAGFQASATALGSEQQSADQGVVQTVGQINTLTAQVATLNGQISADAGAGQTANSLLDQRALAINQLSQLVDVQSITADSNSLTLTTIGGTLLVTGNQSFNLSTQTNPSTGFQDVFAQGSDITTSIQSGNLAGYLQLRDREIPSLTTQLNTLASGIVTSANTQSAAGFDLNGNPGGNFFVPPATLATAALNLSVAITNPVNVAASGDGTPGNNANATALANLQNNANIAGQTPINYYSSLVFQVGNDTANATSTLSGENLIIQQLQDQQSSESGVSLNDEGANIVLYQNAYDAAARVTGVIASLYQTAINMGLVTTS
jgi:flagellar hook-associated protein 1 FlgK